MHMKVKDVYIKGVKMLINLSGGLSIAEPNRKGRLKIEVTLSFEMVQNLEWDPKDSFQSRKYALTDTMEFEDIDFLDAWRELAKTQHEHPFYWLKVCESPIERVFYMFAMLDIPNLKPQISIGHYRVDFAVPDKKVIIELDGHEFHKTKEQRTNDAKRERFLIRQGWQVIRFTGSEIYKDVFGCVEEAKEMINSLPDR